MKRFFRIYSPFAANEMKRQMAYQGAFYLFVIIELFYPFVNFCLWKAIYSSSSKSVLGGLSYGEMVIYVFMSYVSSMLVNRPVSEDIMEDIHKGSVAMNLIKPIDYRISLMSKAIGDSIYMFFVPTIFVWIGVEIYRVVGLHMPAVSVINILLYFCSVAMSLMIYMLFDWCFGMIAFYTTYFFGLIMMKSAVLSFLSGQVIPISFFPEAVRNIFEWLPFSSMIYAPTMVYLGKYTGNELLFVLGRQAFWVIALYGLGSFLWSRVTKRMVVLGG